MFAFVLTFNPRSKATNIGHWLSLAIEVKAEFLLRLSPSPNLFQLIYRIIKQNFLLENLENPLGIMFIQEMEH